MTIKQSKQDTRQSATKWFAIWLAVARRIACGIVFLTVPWVFAGAEPNDFGGHSPISEPYDYLNNGSFTGTPVPESPDPLVAYHWLNTKNTDPLQIYVVKPDFVVAEPPKSFNNVSSLTGDTPDVTVNGNGLLRLDFVRESAAWVEFDSPDCPGGVEMSISEYNEPGLDKTRVPVQHGHTYRLELNDELYDGVRFAWIHVKSTRQPWHITGIRAVCQAKPVNYAGSFSCNDSLLTKVWYASAYGVRACLCRDYFGSILMDRGDRISWTGDAHPAQAAALVAFGNYDFIRQNLDRTAKQSNGIKSYSLYWVFSLLDYYNYSGDVDTMGKFLSDACGKLDEAYKLFGTKPPLRFYGWDERLSAGFEIWFHASPEAQSAYEMLSIRAWRDFAEAMGKLGHADLKLKYNGYATEKLAELRKDPAWSAQFGLHAAADAVSTGMLTETEKAALFQREFSDRVNRVSLTPFNQYFVIQALARMDKFDEALSTMRDMWGGMIQYGGTTPFEVFRPSWNGILGPNDAIPNSQSGIVSLCHPWGAGPVKWLNEEVLGIVPTLPGFKTYAILPHLGRTLTRVSGATPTPYGTIQASYNIATGDCQFSAPVGTVGRIGIPKVEEKISQIRVNGRLAWDGQYHPVKGVESTGEDAGFVYFNSLQPGNYSISVQYQGRTPAAENFPETYAASFIRQDAKTAGNWGGVYGKEGYVLCNYKNPSGNELSLPTYVKSVDFFRAFPDAGLPDNTSWLASTDDRRALAPSDGNGLPRKAAGVSNSDQTMTVTLGIEGVHDYQVALYFVDWNRAGRRQVVEMFDAKTLKLVAPVKMVDHFGGGVYLVYAYNQSAKFRFNKIRGEIVSLNGIFFDAPSGNRSHGKPVSGGMAGSQKTSY